MKTNIIKTKLNKAFSLIELLVVIAVIAVIAAIAIPNLIGTRDAAVDAQDAYEQAAVDRFNAQLRAMGDPNAPYNAAAFQGAGVSFTPQGASQPIVFRFGDGSTN